MTRMELVRALVELAVNMTIVVVLIVLAVALIEGRVIDVRIG